MPKGVKRRRKKKKRGAGIGFQKAKGERGEKKEGEGRDGSKCLAAFSFSVYVHGILVFHYLTPFP